MLASRVGEVFTAVEAAVAALGGLDWDALGTRDRLEALDRLETVRRKAAAHSLGLVGSIERGNDPGLGGACARVIADVIRITPARARRRIRDAAQLQPRTTLTGQRLPPVLPATAAAWQAGVLDGEHVRVIQTFLADLPDEVAPAAAERAEVFLAAKAAELRPDQLATLADRLAIRLNPDGKFTDEYRAARRGFTWCGRQRPDGMSVARLLATPELRATIDALLAKFAAPGMGNPDDQTPTVGDQPTEAAINADRRLHGQRQHDGLLALLRSHLGNPTLGTHRGLPVTIIATTTVDQLSAAAGHAVTAAGTLLPMRDLIRMATHAHHYLCVFDRHTQQPLYLGRAKRIATAAQRLVLHAQDRGCSAPGCDMPGYLCEVHHVHEWADGGNTDIDGLTFACGQHHRLLTTGGWTTHKRRDGTTQWRPPPQIPLAPGTNTYHHPERMLEDEGDAA